MNIPVTILVEGVAYQQRKWPVIPRVGEHVEIGDPQKRLVVVVDVVWRNYEDPRVDVVCEEIVQ